MGSTTKLISDSPPTRGCRCLPGLGSVMVALSLAASLANIARLPAMVFLHGGGSFLAVYVLLALVLGLPLLFLEVLLGQFSQEGVTKLSRAVPLLKGVGLLQVLVSMLCSIYYPVITAVALFYTIWSAKGPLPFSECKYLPVIPQVRDGVIWSSQTTGEGCIERTLLAPPDQEPVWFVVNIALLFLVWAAVIICLCRDGRSYRVSVCCLLAGVVAALVALLTEQLAHSSRGLTTLFTINIDYVLNLDTWHYAVVQLFLSTQIGFGNIATTSGRIYAKSNAFWVTLTHMACSVGVGVGFTCLVYMWSARLEDRGFPTPLQKPQIPELFLLTFMYDVFTHSFPSDNQLWATIAFIAIFFAGLISMMALVFTVTSTVMMESRERWRPWLITAGFCAVCYLVGIICLLPERLALVHLLEQYVISRIIVLATAVQVISFVWIYGSQQLSMDFEFVLGYKLNFIWNFIWCISPLFLIVLQGWAVFASVSSATQPTDPPWLVVTGWSMVAAAWLFVLIVALWQVVTQVDYNICQKLLSSLKPSRNWGPVDPIQRHGWVVWREQCTLSGERDFTLKRRGTRDYTHSVRNAPSEPLGSRYYPHYVKSEDEKTHIRETAGAYSANAVPNYSSTRATEAHTRGSPYVIPAADHVCWRRDLS